MQTPGTKVEDPHKYLDPLALAKVRSLELKARLIVEGYLSGMHKSPFHGFSSSSRARGTSSAMTSSIPTGRLRPTAASTSSSTMVPTHLLDLSLDKSESMLYGSRETKQLRLHVGGRLTYLVWGTGQVG